MQVNGQLCLITESDTLLMDFGTSGYPHCHSYTCIEIMHLSDIAELRLRFFNKREVVLFFLHLYCAVCVVCVQTQRQKSRIFG